MTAFFLIHVMCNYWYFAVSLSPLYYFCFLSHLKNTSKTDKMAILVSNDARKNITKSKIMIVILPPPF